MRRFIYTIIIGITLYSCDSKEEFTDSIFTDVEELDTASVTYDFDVWLIENFREPYNISFKYKYEDVGSDLDYNLVPISIDKAMQMAQLVKYLWFDVYASMVDEDFLKQYGPRILQLVGSPAYNPTSGTIKLGEAEGGIKITLLNCNNFDYTSIDMMNEYYFKTMHHEFAHILHQTKSYPRSFEEISAGNYLPMGWQYRSDSEAAKLGFVSPYAGSQGREDFVEIIANYLVKSDEDWKAILDMAGSDGADIILVKLEICASWLREKWNIDIEAMRNEIISRELNINDDFFDKTL